MAGRLESILDRCLSMMERGASEETCQQFFMRQRADELAPLLRVANELWLLEVPAPSPHAMESGERALMNRVLLEGRPPRGRLTPGRGVPLAAAAALAGLALIGLTLAGPLREAFDFQSLQTEMALADGTVTEVAADSLEISTASGRTTVVIGPGTQITDESGSSVDLEVITPGTQIRVRGLREGGAIVAERIEVRIEVRDGDQREETRVRIGEGEERTRIRIRDGEDETRVETRVEIREPAETEAELEFEGQVIARRAGALTVSTAAGDVVVAITLDTEVKGDLERATRVKVEGRRLEDGSILAREIRVLAPLEATRDGMEAEDGEDGDNSGPGSAR